MKLWLIIMRDWTPKTLFALKLPLLLIMLLIMLGMLADTAWAEYRAYELEVFDRLQNKSEIITTTFSPLDYIATHGGSQRVGVIIRASWICYGDTSNFKQSCPQPQAITPQFQVGDQVEVILKHHVTDGWVGKVENSFYRPDLKSNVYGVRFESKRNLYTRFYEMNLRKPK